MSSIDALAYSYRVFLIVFLSLLQSRDKEGEYWRHLADVLLIYHEKEKHLKGRNRRLQENLIFRRADKLTEILSQFQKSADVIIT